MFQIKGLLSRQCQYSSRCTDNDVWAVGLQYLLILLDVNSSKENCNLDITHVLTKPFILLMNLECQLSRVAHDQHTDLAINWLKLLECSKDKHCCFAHTTFCLTNDIHTKDGLWDAFVLNCKR